MTAILRRRLLAVFALAFAAACSGPTTAAKSPTAEMALGEPGAAVTLIEYASVTCGHCRTFHETVWPTIKAEYVDAGKVRYVFREFRTPPLELATAGFLMARCGGAGPDTYFKRVDLLFRQQNAIFEATQQGRAREALLAIARSAGLTDAQFDACVRDPAAIAALTAGEDAAVKQFDIKGTPTLVINNKKLEGAPSIENVKAALDAALAK